MARKSSIQAEKKPSPGSGWRAHPIAQSPLFVWLANSLGGMALAPLMGLVAALPLLFGGLTLGVAWFLGVQPAVNAQRWAAYSASTSGRIVEAWAAIEFNPASLPDGKLYWQTLAQISNCVVVEYTTPDWTETLRRAYCGMRMHFSEDMRLFDGTGELQAGIPFAFLRDASGFAVQEIRMDKRALEWISTHPPRSTFMLSDPKPTTALGALREQMDWPVDVAVRSWTRPMPSLPLRYDPAHPQQAMPAAVVVESAHWKLSAAVLPLLIGVPGFLMWRFGIGVLFFGVSSPLAKWAIVLFPLLALPWWSETLPRVMQHVNPQWAVLADDMLADVTRATRLLASTPDDATQAHGVRLTWPLSEGEYAQTFGRIHFSMPQPAPGSEQAALAALREQAAQQVRQFPAAEQVALFETLSRNVKNDRKRDVDVFTQAAEDVLRDAAGDHAAQVAARHFLLFGAGYNVWDVDALEAARGAPPAP